MAAKLGMDKDSMYQLEDKKSFDNPVIIGSVETVRKIESQVEKIGSTLYQKNCDVDREITFFQLFRFASDFDIFLIVTSVICAIASGVCFPMTMVYFGETVNTFITKDFTNEEINTMRCNRTKITDWYNST